jgi:ArsR family transcriptional regulator, arsenate/arsenite/antimonite-responsive transcriptional repressor / arsenate reductase (thioredoxin)
MPGDRELRRHQRIDQAVLINQAGLIYRGRVTVRQETAPPWFLQLAGNPLRWQLLSELTRSDRQVRELTALLGQPQNLVSYHLARLREGGLVAARRSSADGRDAYYSIDLARCGELLTAAGAALHPGLRLLPPPPAQARARARVLFLCTGNSTRSQMAQAIMEQLAGESVTAASAGSHPKPVHPNAIAVMREQGIDISGRGSRHMSVFAGQRFDYVISLCDRVREVCPDFPGPPEVIHWSIPDPAAGSGSDSETCPAFRAVATGLRTRIGFLLARINDAASSAQEVR